MPFEDRVSSQDHSPPAGVTGVKFVIWGIMATVLLLFAGCAALFMLGDDVRVSEYICGQAFKGEVVASSLEEQEKVIEKCIDEGYTPDYSR